MYNENRRLFKTEDSARSSLRYIEDKAGEKNRKKTKPQQAEFSSTEVRPPTQLQLPESWSKPKEVFKLPIACNRIAFMSDFQVPFHDNRAIKAFVAWVKQKNPNTLFLNADIADFYGISSFQRDPRQRNFKEELDAIRGVLAWLRSEFPDCVIYYNLDGNHEYRWERWLMQRGPELLDIHEFDLSVLLRLNEFNIIPLRNHKYIQIGKLCVLHGHTIFGKWGSGVSKARSVFLKTFKSTIVSHVHVTDETTKKDLTGKMITCWTTGCFMNIDAVEYNEHNDYNHGGAYIETDNEGNYWVENKRIDKGVIR